MYEQLHNPLTKYRNALDRARLIVLFPGIYKCADEHFLALRRFLRTRPDRFFDAVVRDVFSAWLLARDSANRRALQLYLNEHMAEVNNALLFLREINTEPWHDAILRTGDEHDLIRFIDKHVHPTYLRLVEAVLVPLVRPVAHFSRLDRGKSVEGLQVWSVIQELIGSSTKCLVESYRQVLRNAIAHGGITYLQNEIRYCDGQAVEILDTSTIVRLCDDLLDTCNGLAAALEAFLIALRTEGYPVPQELLVEELRQETLTPWWAIEGCVPAEIGDRRQLIVYARPASRDAAKIQWSAFQSGILAEFFAPGFDRYFFSLRSAVARPGWAAFNGRRLMELRKSGATDIADFAEALEDCGIFYHPRRATPRMIAKVDTLLQSFRIRLPLAREEIHQNLGLLHVVPRNVSIHRNSWGCVLTGEVVIEDLNDEAALILICKQRRRIVRAALRSARRNMHRMNPVRYLPLGWARLAVFRKDYRCRRLSNFGLGPDLICTVQIQRIKRIKAPDIMGSIVEVVGKWRLAWNRAWLEATGRYPLTGKTKNGSSPGKAKASE